ncbi:MAG: hypothetical protein AAFY76_03685 [Cyanobacteria bacterium J06649_11]
MKDILFFFIICIYLANPLKGQDSFRTVFNTFEETCTSNIDIGDYIPLAVSFNCIASHEVQSKPSMPDLYLKIGNLKTTLLELSFDFQTGYLKGFSIILLPNVKLKEALKINYISWKEGIPMLNPNLWNASSKGLEFSDLVTSDYHVSVEEDFNVVLSECSITILFQDQDLFFNHSLKQDNVVFLIKENQSLGGFIIELEKSELNRFRELWLQ